MGEDSVVEESVEKVECVAVAKNNVPKDDDAGSEGTVTESGKEIVTNGLSGKVNTSGVDEDVSILLEASVESVMVDKTKTEGPDVAVGQLDSKVEKKKSQKE